MEFRYLGFSHQGNARVYRFDVVAKGEINRHLTISADISLFLAHHVGIQEGPTLCAQKLAADLEATLETTGETDHQLTADDLQRYAAARTLAANQKAEARRNVPRRAPAETQAYAASPWRGTRA
jgi:hypothetical protein